MRLREKIELTVLFLIGCLVCIFSILRLLQLKNYLTDNLIYSSGMSLIWAVLELDMAIICGSLLLVNPLFHCCMGRVRKGLNRLSSCSQSLDSNRVAKLSHRGSGGSNGFEGGNAEMLTIPTAARVSSGQSYNANRGVDWTMSEDRPGYDFFLNLDRRTRKSTVA
ncbi:hypothetical protein N7467_005504 [Penicillium canescens]|nr:hypothetical protein N7467_005504 [Penicillium canescens]